MSLKVSRGIDSEIIKFLPLSGGYKKVAMICTDRNIEFHAQYGNHFKIRTPKIGRDLCYVKSNADLIVAATGNDLFRLNLEEGRFKTSLHLGDMGSTEGLLSGNFQSSSTHFEDLEEGNFNMGANCVEVGEQLGLVFAGCDDGRLRVFDTRQ
jgi:ribosome biogenesis protein ENP2